MKELNGREIADFVKERQAKAVRGLRQQWKVAPKLAIIRTNPDPVVDSYMKLKQRYGDDILIDVEVHTIDQSEALTKIQELNADDSVHGIIVQIPLPDRSQTDEILGAVSPDKDVDGLSAESKFDAATPLAIIWLLAGYDIDLTNRQVLVVGRGRLVGAPLITMLEQSDIYPLHADRETQNLAEMTRRADVIISATGVPGVITADMVKPDAIIVDAGVATDSNGLVGDVDQSVRELPNVTITPIKGGVGPLTVAALFENVITAARRTIEIKHQ